MATGIKQLLAAAQAAVPKLTPAQAQALLADGQGLLLDVRDAPEVEKSGLAKGAHHVSRGMLEFRADPDSPFYDPTLRRDRPVLLYCASGGRAALAGKTLLDLGYTQVFNLGGFSDWVANGGEVDRPIDPGM